MAPKTGRERAPAERRGLGHWMRRVLKEHDRTGRHLAPRKVHDLRVALRQSRSLADALLEIDPDSRWEEMRKAGKKLFQRLGDLRDDQVAERWIQTLSPKGDDPIAAALQGRLDRRKKKLKAAARRAHASFDRKAWKRWARELPRRALRVPAEVPGPDGSPGAFRYLALLRWRRAEALHRRALRGGGEKTWHELRISLKRFRYLVENFLPEGFSRWAPDFKRLQNILGEIHDLDVLAASLGELDPAPPGRAIERWRRKISRERHSRISEYLTRTGGEPGLWALWRKELPEGEAIHEAALAKLAAWAAFVDPRFDEAERVRRISLGILDSLRAKEGGTAIRFSARARRLLEAASLLHGVGRSISRRGWEKDSWRIIRGLEPPLGWTSAEMRAVALAARLTYRGRAFPRNGAAGVPRRLQNAARRVAMILGLARSLARGLHGPAGAVEVRVASAGGVLSITARVGGQGSPENHVELAS